VDHPHLDARNHDDATIHHYCSARSADRATAICTTAQLNKQSHPPPNDPGPSSSSTDAFGTDAFGTETSSSAPESPNHAHSSAPGAAATHHNTSDYASDHASDHTSDHASDHTSDHTSDHAFDHASHNAIRTANDDAHHSALDSEPHTHDDTVLQSA